MISAKAGSCACSRTGVSRVRVITFTIRAGASPLRRSRLSSMRFATVAELPWLVMGHACK